MGWQFCSRDGVGVGETSDPGVGVGSAERCGLTTPLLPTIMISGRRRFWICRSAVMTMAILVAVTVVACHSVERKRETIPIPTAAPILSLVGSFIL